MNGLFPHFRTPDNCEAQDLDCTWSDMLTPTPESGPACQTLRQAPELVCRSSARLLGLPLGQPR